MNHKKNLTKNSNYSHPINIQENEQYELMSIIEENHEINSEHRSNTSFEECLYTKEISCPVCRRQIKVVAVKSSKIRIKNRDSDFMYIYDGVNPLLYDVWVCTSCGYAALNSLFHKITDVQIKAIYENISIKWREKQYPTYYDENTAIERYKLALLSTIAKNSKSSEKALTCMKLGWIFRIKGCVENEKKYMHNALACFEQAYNSESFPVAGMDEDTLTYLIGELHRRTENREEALKWFGRVLTSRTAKQSLKEMARDQKDLTKPSKAENSNNNNDSLQNSKSSSQKKGFWSGLFG